MMKIFSNTPRTKQLNAWQYFHKQGRPGPRFVYKWEISKNAMDIMAQPSEMLPVVLVNVLSIAHRTDQLAPHKMTVQLSPSQVVFQGFSSIDLKLYPPTYQVNKQSRSYSPLKFKHTSPCACHQCSDLFLASEGPYLYLNLSVN